MRAEDVKNGEARTIPYHAVPRLDAIIEEQWTQAQDIMRETGRFPEFVFVRRGGKALRSWYTAWNNACERAGRVGFLFHDLRRSMARHWTLLGVPEKLIMELGGWKTKSVFDGYLITTRADLAAALERATRGEQLAPARTAAREGRS